MHKDLRNKTADATRRYKSVQPMELQPGKWAEPRAVTWGKAPHEPGDYSSVA